MSVQSKEDVFSTPHEAAITEHAANSTSGLVDVSPTLGEGDATATITRDVTANLSKGDTFSTSKMVDPPDPPDCDELLKNQDNVQVSYTKKCY